MLHAHRAEQARQVRRNVGERRTTQPFCPRPRAARFGAASGLEGHGRAQRSEHDRPYHDAPRGSSPATATSDTTPRNTQFDYSADEERLVRRDVDVSTLHFVSDLYQRKFDTFDTTLEERFRLYAGDRQLGEIVRKDGSDKTLFFHTDHLGSTDTISDSTGASFTQHFDPFGTPINPPNPELTRVGFTGQDQDVDLGFTDMKGRMYDPLAGRFASADPVMQAPFWSQGLNLYSYAFNDPINNTDPSGFDATSFDDPVVGVTAWGGGVTGLAAVSGFGASASIGGALGGFGNVAISALTGFPGTAGRLGGTYSGVAPTAAPAASGVGQGSLSAVGQHSPTGVALPNESGSANSLRGRLKDTLAARPRFSTEELAAYVAADRIYPQSLRLRKEFATLIVKQGRQYTFLKPIQGRGKDVPEFPSWYTDISESLPDDARIVGWVHSHGVQIEGYVHSEEFSSSDRAITRSAGITGYLVTPTGQFLSLDPVIGSTQRLGGLAPPGQPIYEATP